MILPPHIALCGPPQHGKSETQRILQRRFNYTPIDDGLPLRKAGMNLFGLTWEQVSTTAGKVERVTVCDEKTEVRELLGWLGTLMEERFGEGFLAEKALEQAQAMMARGEATRFSYGSVRRSQGAWYKDAGGAVIEIIDPRKLSTGGYEFDGYDRSLVDVVIENDGTLEDLEEKVVATVQWLARQHESILEPA